MGVRPGSPRRWGKFLGAVRNAGATAGHKIETLVGSANHRIETLKSATNELVRRVAKAGDDIGA